jgi:hypothetical protein
MSDDDYAENDTFPLWKKTFNGTFNIISLDGQWILIKKKTSLYNFIAIKVSGKL